MRTQAKLQHRPYDTTHALEKIVQLGARLGQNAQVTLQKQFEYLAWLKSRLDASSYKRVLERGFCLVESSSHHLISQAQGLEPGARIRITWHDGQRSAQILNEKQASG